MHATIFWGFMVLTAGTVEILIQGVFRGFSFALFLPQPLYQLYALSQDVFAVLVIARGRRSRSIAGWCSIRSGSRATSSSTPTR